MAQPARLPDPLTAEQLYLPFPDDYREKIAQYLQRVAATDDISIVVIKGGVRKTYSIKWSARNGVIEIEV